MSQTTTTNPTTPVRSESFAENVDPEALAFRENFEARSPLDEIVREGARKLSLPEFLRE